MAKNRNSWTIVRLPNGQRQWQKAPPNGGPPGAGVGSGASSPPPTDVDKMLDWFNTATDADVDQFLADIRSVDIDANGKQQDDDITRFFNRLGWTSRTPEVLKEQQWQQEWKNQGQPTRMYHADDSFGGTNAKEFALQFMGRGMDFSGNLLRHYLSNGIAGNGTYFADRASRSANYGTNQFRGFLNGNAKVIDRQTLRSEIAAKRASNSAFDKFFGSLTGGYSGQHNHDDDAAMSVYAAMRGYNTIVNSFSGYYTVLDRSVITMSAKQRTITKHKHISDW